MCYNHPMTDGHVRIETGNGTFGLAITEGRVKRTMAPQPLKRLEGLSYTALANYCTARGWRVVPTKPKRGAADDIMIIDPTD